MRAFVGLREIVAEFALLVVEVEFHPICLEMIESEGSVQRNSYLLELGHLQIHFLQFSIGFLRSHSDEVHWNLSFKREPDWLRDR